MRSLTEYYNFGQFGWERPVGYLRKLPESAGPCRDLLMAALRDLHLHAGEPSTRAIARAADNGISHDTVNRVLRGEELPRWRSLELVVKALGGDVEAFRGLWVAARRAQEPGSG